jgi:hypothetical protein
MSMRAFLWAALAAYALFGALACSFDDGANAANGCDERCARCHLGFCLAMREDGISGGGSGATSGASGVGGAVSGGSGGMSPNGGAGGAGAGGAGAGGAGAGGAGAGGAGAGGAGAGGAGAGGAGGSSGCAPGMSAGPESCNGIDDDCNGNIDEGTSVACYPANTDGCSAEADGTFDCSGLCTSGTQACVDGELGACEDAVTPADEACGGDEAADEDCDGEIDDGCVCEGDETQRCYSGPRFTAGIGECQAGRQACINGTFGACENEVTPVPETCANSTEDNNCNGRVDDVPNQGTYCFDFSEQGQCAFGRWACAGDELTCITNEAEEELDCDGLDEDCDGDVDETFVFPSDEQNCGMCGRRCDEGELCCDGMCRDIGSDLAHCGGCGDTCDASCCDGNCVTTNTVDYCLACNVQCEAGSGCCAEGCAPLDTVEHCGDCETQCEAGFGCCEEGCAPLDTVLHCGDCSTACLEGQTCTGGLCVPAVEEPCEAGGTFCPPGPCRFCVEGECQDNMGNVCQ